MSDERWRIPKDEMPVTLWVHPEGRVVGSIFVEPGENGRHEDPLDVFNRERQFVILKRGEPEEIRFYNRSSILRVEYADAERPPLAEGETRPLACSLHLMDGSLLEGTLMKSMPPDRQRLFDLLNEDDCFIRLYLTEGGVVLVNKRYVHYVSAHDE